MPVIAYTHTQREAHGLKDGLNLVQRFFPKIVKSEHLNFTTGDQLADRLDFRRLQAICSPHTQLHLLDRPQKGFEHARVIGCSRLGFLFFSRFLLRKDPQMVHEQVRRFTHGDLRGDGSVGPHLKKQPVVVGRPADTRVLDLEVDL